MHDIGLTHVALNVSDIDRSVCFYERYARMHVVHRRTDHDTGVRVVWLSDGRRPFALVLAEGMTAQHVLGPFAHLGVGCESREDVARLSRQAAEDGALVRGPEDGGYPVGYWAFLRDPDGHTLEVSFGQEVGLTAATR